MSITEKLDGVRSITSARSRSSVKRLTNVEVTLEHILCASVVLVAIAFYAFMWFQTGTGRLSSYEIFASMGHADSMAVGEDIRISGVKVGSITSLSLNKSDYTALVGMRIRDDIYVPIDSAFIPTQGTMSGSYITVKPGRSASIIKPGTKIDLASTGVKPSAKTKR